MNEKEKKILNLIEKDPLMSQKEIAKRLGIKRVSVAAYIKNLIDKGIIKGKGYLFNPLRNIIVAGAANIDITGKACQLWQFGESIPGNVSLSCGGVGRNIAENLSRLGHSVKMITALGDDIYSEMLKNEALEYGLDYTDSLQLGERNSSLYLCLLDEKGEMMSAVSDMHIMEELSVDFIRKKINLINKSSAIVMDTNLPQETFDYILSNRQGVPAFVDPVSVAKSGKILNCIEKIHTLKPNKQELEFLSGVDISSETGAQKAMDELLQKGVFRIFLSLGKEGIVYKDREGVFLKKKNPSAVVKNATGAGDAFMAGLVDGFLKKLKVEETLDRGLMLSAMTVESSATVSTRITKDVFERENVQ